MSDDIKTGSDLMKAYVDGFASIGRALNEAVKTMIPAFKMLAKSFAQPDIEPGTKYHRYRGTPCIADTEPRYCPGCHPEFAAWMFDYINNRYGADHE